MPLRFFVVANDCFAFTWFFAVDDKAETGARLDALIIRLAGEVEDKFVLGANALFWRLTVEEVLNGVVDRIAGLNGE